MRPVWAVKAMFVIVLASILFRCVSGANHKVGGASGWDLESNMQDWASTESFNVHDDLVFTYTPLYDVIEVNQQGYNTCTIANAISTYNSGETVIHLTESGTRYFVCGRMGHCQQGLKLKVKVQAQSNNTGTSPPPISPPCPHSPPSPPDDKGSTKCRSEAAEPSAVDLEFHDSLTEDALQQAVFEVKSFDNQNSIFSYYGDAEIQETEVHLSNEMLSPSRQCVSSGALFFHSPLIFYDFKKKRPLSFKTSFGFSISTLATPKYYGHGISFIISSTKASRDGPSAYPNNFFGVSIDTTNLDPFGTPADLYIRLFNNSSSALASAKFIEDIRSGEEYTCWVEFEAITEILMVYVGIGLIKPVKPLLVTRGEALSSYLSSNNGVQFVGLTGSSNGCTEVYHIHSWALKMEQKKVEEEVNLEQQIYARYRAYENNNILATLVVIAAFVVVVAVASLCLNQEKLKV